MRRNPDERLRRRARDLAAGAGTMDDRLAQEAAILRTEGLAWRTRVPRFLVEWDSNQEPLLSLDNDRKAYEQRAAIERYLVNRLIVGDYDQREAWLLFLGMAQKHRRSLTGRSANELQARFLDQLREPHGLWTDDELSYVLARPLVDPWPGMPTAVRRDWQKIGLSVFKGMPRQNPSSDQRNPLPDSDDLAQKLYDAGWTSQEIPLSSVNLSTSDRGHPVVDSPEDYRWFLIPKFKVKDFGLRLNDLMREAGPYASHEKWRHDRIAEKLQRSPAWPAIVAADGVLVDGFHRITANRTLKRGTMPVVVAVNRSGSGHWDEAWLEGARRENPSSDQRRRELERRAALGDADAAAQLEAMIHRAPATPGEAIEAGDPVRLAWQAWQDGRGTLADYQLARGAEVAARPSWDIPPPTKPLLGDDARLFGAPAPSPGDATAVLDTPQADAVLQAYDHATGKPWQSALSYSGWGRRAKPTVAQAYQIVRAYYESLGYHQDGMAKGYTGSFAETIGQGRRAPNRMPTLISDDGMRRVVFSRTTVRREVGGRGRWQRDYSRDPADQVGIIALAEALMRRALRAKDWRANPDGMQLARDWRAAARADDAAGHNDAAQFWRGAAAGAFLASNPPPGPTICAWCPLYGRPPAVIVPGDPSQPASHGLCAACKADMKAGRATEGPGSPAP